MFVVVLWQPAEAVHDEFVEWFCTKFMLGMLESPGLFRCRIFMLQHASILEDEKTGRKDGKEMKQYMTVWDSYCDELL